MAEPPITLHAIHDDGPGNLTPSRIVIHATCPNIGYPAASKAGAARGTAAYFQSKTAGGSAHYVLDPVDEQHCVADAHVAWHAPPNPRSIGIEICAEGGDYARSYTREQWLSSAVWPAVVRAAARTAELCDRFKIPKVRLTAADLVAGRHGICGHVDVSTAFRQSSHSDPGAAFPWPEFMAAVNGAPTPAAPAAPPTQEDVMAPIPITVAEDGSFRATVAVEAGSNSAVVARAWVTFGTAWGAAHFRVCAIGANGQVMGPDAEKRIDLANNARDYLPLPDGACLVTIEGNVLAADAVPAAALITAPK